MKTYTVIGTLPVLGHQPGETFEAEIPEWQERRLVHSRALSVDDAPAPATEETPSPKRSDLSALTRVELDVRAVEAGIDPEQFATKADLVEAIEQAAEQETPDASGNDE